ncbi:NADH-quinone oxidoreductase subunit H, partial [Anaerovibrio sp.]|uniref:NADH-quinone oxidoreductase subunit H n=1 Tax=Anaerovibrio sp. TaxID=1872532 RepID=UPI00388F54C6
METLMTSLGLNLVQGILLLIFAPLVAGIINKTKARLQKRRGASIFQEYFDICKWWKKATVLTPYTSVIFILAPVVYFMTSLYAATMVPGFLTGQFTVGDAFIFVYILA